MITVGYCSKYHDVYYHSFLQRYFGDRAKIVEKLCNEENGVFLSQAYNEILRDSENDTVVLLHNNVDFIMCEKYIFGNVADAIEYQFDNNPEYGIIGAAPRNNQEHDVVMRDYFPNEYLYPECDENGENTQIYRMGFRIPDFSTALYEDVCVDGMFMALRKSRLKVWFDERNKTFDFHDVEICLANYLEGVKIGLTKAFCVRHWKTRGEENAWGRYLESKGSFKERFGDRLPVMAKKNRPWLVLITGLCNRNNFSTILQSVKDTLMERNDLDLFWVLANDTHNGYGVSEEEVMNTLADIGMPYQLYYSGKEGQKNYGGDLFNYPLQDFEDRFAFELDPWVYILDGDNLICPLMSSQITDMINAAETNGKRAIWMSMNREDGFIDTVRSYSVYGRGVLNTSDRAPADEFMPDPSQMIMKLSLIKDFGYFDGGYAYDQKLWWYFYNHLDEVAFPEDWHPGHWLGRGSNNFFQCYHDGMIDRKIYDSVKDSIKNDEPVAMSLVVGRNEVCDRFILPDAYGKQVFLGIEEEEKKYKYSILTCIFGDYEKLKPIKDYREDVEYVCVTDNPDMKSDQWKIICEPDFFNKLPDIDKFSYVRFHPFNFVESDICITLDASVEILKDFYPDVVKRFISGGYDYAVTLHNRNATLLEEVNDWKNIRGYKEGCYEHILKVLGDDANIRGEVLGGFIIHRDSKYGNKINEMAWEICHALSNDNAVDRNFQVGLSYVVNKICNDEDRIMLIHPSIFEGKHIRLWNHGSSHWYVYNSRMTCPCVFWNKEVKPIEFND